MEVIKKLFVRFASDTEGQDLIEYALLAATIALGVGGAMLLVQAALQTEFNSIATSINAAGS